MESDQKDAQLVAAVAKLLVRHPENVHVERTIDDLGVLLTLRVHAEDMAGIVGREGRTAKAIRTLLRVIGAQNGERVNLKIAEPTEGSSEGRRQDADTAPTAAPSTTTTDSDSSSSFINLDDIPEPLA